MGRQHVVEDMATDSEDGDLPEQPQFSDEEGDTSASDEYEDPDSEAADEEAAALAAAAAEPPQAEGQVAAPQPLPAADGLSALLNGDVSAEAAVLDVEVGAVCLEQPFCRLCRTYALFAVPRSCTLLASLLHSKPQMLPAMQRTQCP